jgi:hypothetical protein
MKCLHFPDGNRKDLITMTICDREFYDSKGYVYHPSYKSIYCDDEQTHVSKLIGAYRFIDLQIFEHRHANYGKAAFDETYKQNFINEKHDQLNFIKRQSNGFKDTD